MSQGSQRKFAELLAQNKTRVFIHLAIVFAIALVRLFADMETDLSDEELKYDKQLHQSAGRWIAVTVFYIVYFAMCVFILNHKKFSLTIRLLFLPTAIVGIMFVASVVIAIIAMGKEAVDSTGMGNVEWADFTATMMGAYTPNITSLSILLGITPALIPLDLLLQVPEKMTRDKSTGHHEMDSYLEERGQHSSKKNIDVLLLEDDIGCATPMMKFCKKLGLTCHHVEGLDEAEKALNDFQSNLKLIISDVFVRVSNDNQSSTGADWLKSIHARFPGEQRHFAIVVITGHPEFIDNQDDADLIMEKPWKPKELLQFMLDKKIVTK